MPELPEVETIRLGLRKNVLHKPIGKVEVRKKKIVRTPAKVFQKTLQGAEFKAIDRRGKLMIISLAGKEQSLLIHLKMTGQLIYQDSKKLLAGGHPWPPLDAEVPNKYTHVIFAFADGSHLYFNDLRQFGFMQLVLPQQLQKILDRYGIDPLHKDFTWPAFREAVSRRRIGIKAALLNQEVIAGIGNIYADEICHHARVHPTRSAASLSDQELKALFTATKHIIAKAIKHKGTTFQHFRDVAGRKGNFTDHLKVYGRGGQACKRCKDVLLHKEKIAGRGTAYCPQCQI